MADEFDTVSNIRPELPHTWIGKIFLTLDLDWASDHALLYAIEAVERANVSATWLITHETPLLGKLRSNPHFELGIHPNFNPLLDGTAPQGETARTVMERLLEIVPEATAVRSHSLAQSSRLLDLLADCGLTHEINSLIPAAMACHSVPWKMPNGIIRVPFWWEDDLAFHGEQEARVGDIISNGQIDKGVNCINFHPIHVYLNTSSQSQYEGARLDFQNPSRLSSHRSVGEGTHTDLEDVLRLAMQP